MGMVSVRPGKLPAKVMVAPNSPSARAQHSTAPAPSDGATSGTVTRRNTVIRRAPRVAAASSKPWSEERSAPSTVMIRNGMATKVSAITTAADVNGIVSPNQELRYRPRNPVGPKASSRATPPATRRQPQRRGNQGAQQPLAGEPGPGQQPGQRHADDQRDGRGRGRGPQR